MLRWSFNEPFFESESNLLQVFFDVRQSNSGKHPFLNTVMLNVHKQMILGYREDLFKKLEKQPLKSILGNKCSKNF